MRSTLSLIRREFTAYFLSPIAYVVLTVFLLGTGGLYYNAYQSLTITGPRGVEFPLAALLGDGSEGVGFPIFWLVFLFIPPLLTMRLLAEERGTGTMEMLMTAPIKDWQIVFAKFVACFAFYLLMWVPTVAYLPSLMDLHAAWDFAAWTPFSIAMAVGFGLALVGLLVLPFGWVGRGFVLLVVGLAVGVLGAWLSSKYESGRVLTLTAGIDPWPVLTSYIGVLAVGVLFLALGLFVSSLVKSQMIAALVSITLGIPLLMPVLFMPEMDPAGLPYQVFAYITVPHHFGRDFTRGVLDTRHLTFYLTGGLLFLFLTVRSVESQRR
ncbi:MAG TPA: ABC transporter permease [Gemmataceae bacterium]|jgi:ABC-2 type transport system permease protein|nr:ABC transporter permease [Gemmataceae bacterium]